MRKMIVVVSDQQAKIFDGDLQLKTYTVSTAKNGIGCQLNSYCTPSGKLRVAQKIGAGMPTGTVFRGRKATGEMWNGEVSEEDLILTRILWLEGCETLNANTLDRYIYL